MMNELIAWLIDKTSNEPNAVLKASTIETPVGPMRAVADAHHLYLLEFFERLELVPGVERLKSRLKSSISFGTTAPLESISRELKAYFNGSLDEFFTPIKTFGTEFQKGVWNALQDIPRGGTLSYAGLALAINKPTACRAVARANSTNQLAILIPCHRVINSDGGLGGYAGGVHRKAWLLDHEKN